MNLEKKGRKRAKNTEQTMTRNGMFLAEVLIDALEGNKKPGALELLRAFVIFLKSTYGC